MKRTYVSIRWAVAVFSVSLLAGCISTDADRREASRRDSEYQSSHDRNAARERYFFNENRLAAWVKFKNANRARVFNAARAALASQGFTPAASDRKAGTIYGSHAAVSESRQPPVLIWVKSDNKDVIVAISVSRVFGLMGSPADIMRGIKDGIRRELKVRAKNYISASQTPKAEPKKEKKDAREKEAAASGNANTEVRPPVRAGSVHFVCVSKCSLRRIPDEDSPATAELLEYDWVRVIKTRSDWCQVETGTGSVGWLSQNLIK